MLSRNYYLIHFVGTLLIKVKPHRPIKTPAITPVNNNITR
jgi:hypothetical protein